MNREKAKTPYRKDAEYSGAIQTQEVHVYENQTNICVGEKHIIYSIHIWTLPNVAAAVYIYYMISEGLNQHAIK